MTRALLALIALLLVAGCQRSGGNEAPPRQTADAEIPVLTSHLVVPVKVPIAELEAMLNAEAPRQLWSINTPEQVCVPPQRVRICLKHARPCEGEACRDVPCKVGTGRFRVTPAIRCRIEGEVTRGAIRLSGRGETMRLSMPVSATVRARDIGGVIRQETATAAAEVQADVRLLLRPDWTPEARIDIDYGWTKPPGIEILGRRIGFANRADPELQKLVRRLEAELPAQVARLDLRPKAESAWKSGFAVVSLNRRNPAVWMRVTPQKVSSGGYRFEGDHVVLRLGLDATSETFVGLPPPPPPAQPLPPLNRLDGTADSGLNVHIPVLADYAELVPVLERELKKIEATPLDLPVAGPTRVGFGTPILYTAVGGRIAVGLPMTVKPSRQILATRGTVWLTGVPFNEPDSRKVIIRDLTIAGRADDVTGNLLLVAAQSPEVLGAVEDALRLDFEGDFGKLMVKIDRALNRLRIGDMAVSATITEIRNGRVLPVGQGLYLPVAVRGEASLSLEPNAATPRR
ncbi:MAG: DUF4403 family protein [Sphingomonadaceae bacterium]